MCLFCVWIGFLYVSGLYPGSLSECVTNVNRKSIYWFTYSIQPIIKVTFFKAFKILRIWYLRKSFNYILWDPVRHLKSTNVWENLTQNRNSRYVKNIFLFIHLNIYFNFYVCVSIHLFLCQSIQIITPIPDSIASLK